MEKRARNLSEIMAPKQPEKKESNRKLLNRYLFVCDLVPGGVAEKAGLCIGDHIVAINSRPVGPDLQEPQRIYQEQDGRTVLSVLRDGNELTIPLTAVMDPETQLRRIGIAYTLRERTQREGEKKSRDFEERPIAFQNTKGEIFAEGKITIEVTEEGTPPEIGSYVLMAKNKAGETKAYDILAEFNTTNAKVIWNKDLAPVGQWMQTAKTASIRDPFNPMTPWVLLHELRHADQHDSLKPRFNKLQPFYRLVDKTEKKIKDQSLFGRSITVSMAEEIVAAAFPDADVNSMLKGPIKWLNEHKSELDRLDPLMRKSSHLTYEMFMKTDPRYADILPDADEDEQKNVARWIELEKEWLTLPMIGSANLKDVLSFPRLVIERDAEYGALIALRKIKKDTGINLFQEQPIARGGASFSPDEIEKIIKTEEEEILKIDDKTEQERERKRFQTWLVSPDITLSVFKSIDDHMEMIGFDRGCFNDIKTTAAQAKKEEKTTYGIQQIAA